MTPPVVLSIAGSDSGGGAGIQADLKAMSRAGVHGCTAITALTAQNSVGVQGVSPVAPEFVREQIDSVCSDFDLRATKTGMLFGKEIIQVVVEECERLSPLVVDPVMVAESGDSLLEEAAEEILVERLLPRADLITPNLPEARKIGKQLELSSDLGFEQLGRELAASLSGPGVLLKGGHREQRDRALDLLVDSTGNVQEFGSEWIETRNTHGSGCVYSSLIASYVAHGEPIEIAVEKAKQELTRGIRSGYAPGEGAGTLNLLRTHPDDP